MAALVTVLEDADERVRAYVAVESATREDAAELSRRIAEASDDRPGLRAEVDALTARLQRLASEPPT